MTPNLHALPAGWEWKKLGDVVTEISSKVQAQQCQDLPYLSLENIESQTGKLLNVSTAKESNVIGTCSKFSKDAVIYSKLRPYLNKVAIPDFDGVGTTELIVFQPKDNLDKVFLANFLRSESVVNIINASSYGAKMPRTSSKFLKELEIPLPPLDEQKRLVSLLGTLFAKIDRSIELLDENIAAADALLPSALNTVFCEFKETCETQKFDEIKSSNVIGLVRNSNEQHINHNFKYVKMNNITNDNHFSWRNITGVNATSEEAIKFSLQKGDFLFNTRNSIELVGKTCLFDSDEKNVLFNNNIMRVRFKTNVLSSFVAYQFSSQYIKQQLEKIKSGTTNVAAIYYKTLKDIDLIIPPLNIQTQSVEYLDSVRTKVEILKRVQNDKINNLKALKASILDRAFKGEF